MPPSSSQTEVQWVTEDIIREHFNKNQLTEIQSGAYTERIPRDSHPAKPPAGEPHCTRSQIVYYYDSDGNLAYSVS